MGQGPLYCSHLIIDQFLVLWECELLPHGLISNATTDHSYRKADENGEGASEHKSLLLTWGLLTNGKEWIVMVDGQQAIQAGRYSLFLLMEVSDG